MTQPLTRLARLLAASFAAALLASCSNAPKEPIPITPPSEVAKAPVARVPIPDTPRPVTPAPPASAPSRILVSNVPAGTQYVCVGEAASDGSRPQTAIQFDAKVAQLCMKHPEMGPCQYEREVCRRSGGRVFTADSSEITLATEAEYDKKVIRVRFKGDDGPPSSDSRRKSAR
jgi:hypothetical protein